MVYIRLSASLSEVFFVIIVLLQFSNSDVPSDSVLSLTLYYLCIIFSVKHFASSFLMMMTSPVISQRHLPDDQLRKN